MEYKKFNTLVFYLVIVSCFLLIEGTYASNWNPAENQLFTRWAKEVTPENVWTEYPRPQLQRENWLNLNGLWDYTISDKDAKLPGNYDGQILVPFAIESALSGVKEKVGPDQKLWYKRIFNVPENWNERLLLHFGAVDWEASVWVNGEKVGVHKGGYTPFSFDITDYVKLGKQELIVGVWDPTDSWTQPRGKQVSEPGGIWYTSVTGIWQTVWLEAVPDNFIENIDIKTDVDQSSVDIKTYLSKSDSELKIKAVVTDDGKVVFEKTVNASAPLRLTLPNAKLWTPDSPFLYDLTLTLFDGEKEIDKVESYFGLRNISIKKDDRGYNQIYLNGERLFNLGPLDQGWWPDGLYTPPSDEAMVYDLKVTKDLGFNMLRKHVKIEPARFYYHCDRLGLLVWQDMPNGNLRENDANNLKINFNEPDADRPNDSAVQFEKELTELITGFNHFPSIVMWVIFNEGWGQYETGRLYKMVEGLDDSRLINVTSGWEDRGIGDVEDIHEYPGPGIEPVEEDRAAVLGEFGGLGWPVENHMWWDKRNWGYQTYFSREELNKSYLELVGNVLGCIGYGLASAVYTQTTDVEGEVNGFMTYDREIVKYNAEELRTLHNKIYNSLPVSKDILSTSELNPQIWKYSFQLEESNWTAPDYNDKKWNEGESTFQTERNAGAFPTGTVWPEKEIFLRKEIDIKNVPENLWLQFYVDAEESELFINGKSVKKWEKDKFRYNRRHYRHVNITEYTDLLNQGKNTIAVYAIKQREKGGVDIGLYTLMNP